MSDRYHLLLTVDGRPVMHGWWNDRVTADRKLSAWVGDYGSTPGVGIALVDTAVGREAAVWPNRKS